MTTDPRSPEAAPALEPSLSAVMVPEYDETDKSEESESPSATVVMKLRVTEPDPEK